MANKTVYDVWHAPGYRKHQVVSYQCGSRHVHSVVFQRFDPEMQCFHDEHVHWTRAFTYLHLHPSTSVLGVTWMGNYGEDGGISFAKWTMRRDTGMYTIGTDSTPLLREQLHVCGVCQKTEDDGAYIRVYGNDDYRCDECEKARAAMAAATFPVGIPANDAEIR